MRPPLRPRLLYLEVRGPWPLPLYLGLPLLLLEWALLLGIFVLKTRRLFRGVGPGGGLVGVLALRRLPPLELLRVEAGRVRVRVGLW